MYIKRGKSPPRFKAYGFSATPSAGIPRNTPKKNKEKIANAILFILDFKGLSHKTGG